MSEAEPMWVLSVHLPDRPGALGAVASRIGACGIDIGEVTITGSVAGAATDVFLLRTPAEFSPELLVAELGEVDGVVVESLTPSPD